MDTMYTAGIRGSDTSPATPSGETGQLPARALPDGDPARVGPGIADEQLHTTMVRAARGLSAATVDAFDPNPTLRALVAGVLAAVPHAAAAGVILIDRKDSLSAHAPSNEVVCRIDQLQVDLREGPGIDALEEAGGAGTGAADLSSDLVWSTFGPAALGAGFAAVLSFPLPAQAVSGSVTVYGTAPHCFTTHDRLVGSLFACQAGIALTGAKRAGELNRALSSRDTIARAKGVLMERFRVNDAEAFAVLVESSQHTNLKLHDVASWLVGEAEALYARERSKGSSPVPD